MRKKYFIQRDRKLYTEYTKEQIRDMINLQEKSTVLPFLEAMDYPYIDYIWEKCVKQFGNQALDYYISKMQLHGLRYYTWKDSEEANNYFKGYKIYE